MICLMLKLKSERINWKVNLQLWHVTWVVEVELPPSTPLEVSITGPQPDWGTIGWDVQFAIKDVDLNPQWFTNIKILE